MAIESMILLLSDMHFGRDLHLAPELPPLRVTRLANWLQREKQLERFFERNCRGHSFACVSMLPRYLKSLLREARTEGFREDSFDLCIILGDQATVPDAEAYRFLREYLTTKRYSGPGDLNCAGLDLPAHKILAVPGNHDKLLRKDLDLYHQEFTNKLNIPRVEPGGSLVVTKTIGKREFVFILVDASVYTSEELVVDFKFRDHLARGLLTHKLYDELHAKLTSLKKEGEADGARLVGPYDQTVKVMLVHYAVDISRLTDHPLWVEKLLPHDCKGLDDALERFRVEFQINMAFHGHLHIPGLYNHKGVQVVAASTTTEQKGPNGFFIVKILDTGEIRGEHHCWTGSRFTADPDTTLNKQLVLFPHGVAA
jgi:predicted phosphodiesterase